MTDIKNHLAGAAGVLAVALATVALPCAAAGDDAAMIAAGQKIAFDRAKGNCLACHHIDGGEAPGNIGPPLIAMNVRYPTEAKLRAQIWDATVANPNTAMPPFGRHHILTEHEIDEVTAFIWSK